MIKSLIFAALLLAAFTWAASNQSQIVSDDGRKLVTNTEGKVSLYGSPDEWVLGDADRYRRRGQFSFALSVCDRMLATNAASRWARWERMVVYADLGDYAKSEQDFNELTNRYPNFIQAYNEQALLLLQQPPPEKGPHSFLEWLNSPDERKRLAARSTVQDNLGIITNRVDAWLSSPDERIQNGAIEILRLGSELDDTVKYRAAIWMTNR